MSKYTNLNTNLNLTSKEETMLELWKKWSMRVDGKEGTALRAAQEKDAIRNAINEYVSIREQASRDTYWGKVADTEELKAQTTGDDDKPNPIWDKEELTDEEITLMEYYVQYTKWLENHPLTHKWNQLKAARAQAWSIFLEEVDTNWLRVTRYEEKLNTRLYLMELEGKTPTPESWDKAMSHLSKLKDDVVKFYENKDGILCVDYRGYQGPTWTSRRNHITFPLFQAAQSATKAAAQFWETKEGKELTKLKEERAATWWLIEKTGLNTRFRELNQLVNSELNLNFTWGEVSEDADNPTLKQADRGYDVPSDLWYVLAGAPIPEEHYHICTYSEGDKTPTTQEALDEYYKAERSKEDAIMEEIDTLILEESWTLEEEEHYQQSMMDFDPGEDDNGSELEFFS